MTKQPLVSSSRRLVGTFAWRRGPGAAKAFRRSAQKSGERPRRSRLRAAWRGTLNSIRPVLSIHTKVGPLYLRLRQEPSPDENSRGRPQEIDSYLNTSGVELTLLLLRHRRERYVVEDSVSQFGELVIRVLGDVAVA